MSERERVSLLDRAWKAKAKGRPMRWRILRDMVACLSLEWMTIMEIQICMRRLWALKNNTTRDILEELESEKSVVQERDEKTKMNKWGSTREGVKFWILATGNIPVSVVQVVQTTMLVERSVPGGPSP